MFIKENEFIITLIVISTSFVGEHHAFHKQSLFHYVIYSNMPTSGKELLGQAYG